MFINKNYLNLEEVSKNYVDEYLTAKPFPSIVFDNFFKEDVLNKILDDFPSNIDKIGNQFNNKAEKKRKSQKSTVKSFPAHTMRAVRNLPAAPPAAPRPCTPPSVSRVTAAASSSPAPRRPISACPRLYSHPPRCTEKMGR